MNEVVIPLKIQGIAQMKAELRELKGELANATDPAQMAALAQKAGELTDKIKDTNEAVKVFASGSKFEQVSNGLGGIKDSLMSLDFEEAAEKSKTFATALGGINPAEIGKAMGGLVTTVGTLGAAFIKLGVQILINPIFLIPIIIAAIIAAIALVLKSFGVLNDVIDALMAPINALIQGFKNLTDWMGLTDFAAEEDAERAKIRSEETLKQIKKEADLRNVVFLARQKAYEDEDTAMGVQIALMKIQKKDSTDLERARLQSSFNYQDSIIRETYALEGQLKKKNEIALVDLRAAAKRTGDYTAWSNFENKMNEQINKNREKNQEALKKASELRNKLILFDAEQVVKTDEKAAEIAKAAAEKAKVLRDKYRAADKASEAEIAEAAKILSDSKKTAQQKELDDLAAAYKIKIDTAIKYKNDTTALLEVQKIQEKVINDKYEAETAAAMAASHASNIAKIDAYNAELAELTDTVEQKLYDKYEADKIKFADNELALFNLKKKYEEDTTALKKTEADKRKAIDQAAFQAKKSIISSEIDAAKGLVNLLAGLGEKNKKIQKAALIANGALSIAEIINNSNVGASQEIATKGIFGLSTSAILYIKMATSIASVVAATAKGLSALGGGSISANSGGGGGGGGDTTSTTAVAPASAAQLFGQANTGSQVNAGGGTGQNITVTAVVSETEITASQNHINNIQNNSVL